MKIKRRPLIYLTVALAFLLITVTAGGQNRMTVPQGTVLELRTENELNSSTSRISDPFNATVSKSVWLDGAIAVPENSTVRGHVTNVQAARRSEPGVIGVAFDTL